MAMANLSSLSIDLLTLILDYLEYASDVNALSRTCQGLYKFATTSCLYPRFAKTVSPHGIVRLVKCRNLEALDKLISIGLKIEDYDDLPREITGLLVELYGPTFEPLKYSKRHLVWAVEQDYVELVNVFIDSVLDKTQYNDWAVKAASHGSLASLQSLIEAGIDLKCASSANILHEACKKGHIDIVTFLLDAGIDPGIVAIPDDHTWDGIHFAASTAKLEVVQLLLEKGASYKSKKDGKFDLEALSSIACCENAGAGGYLTRWRKGVIRVREYDQQESDSERTANLLLATCDTKAELQYDGWERKSILLLCAAFCGDENLVQQTLQALAPYLISGYKEQRDMPGDIGELYRIIGETVHASTRSGRNKIMQSVLDAVENSKNPERLAEMYTGAIQIAIMQGHESSLQLLIERVSEDMIRERLCSGSFLNSLNPAIEPKFEMLVDRQLVSVGSYSYPVRDTLAKIIRSRCWRCTLKLMDQNGLGPYDTTGTSTTILEGAAEYFPFEGFKQIIARGVGLDPESPACMRALKEAALRNKWEIVELFLDHGFDANGPDPSLSVEYNHRPWLAMVLQSVGMKDNIAVMNLLINRGADVNAWALHDKTVLAEAVRCGYASDFVNTLLEKGADPLLRKNNKRCNALEVAIENAKPQIVLQLLKDLPWHEPRTRAYVHWLVERSYGWEKDMLEGDEMEEEERWQGRWQPWDPAPLYDGQVQPCYIPGTQKTKAWWDKFFTVKVLRSQYFRAMYPARSAEGN